MLKALIQLSLTHRTLILVIAGVLFIVGGYRVTKIPVDVFPDLTAPTVTVITEGLGLAPQEMELLVTFPLESALNGAPGIRRVRSVSAAGISVIWAEFEWGEDIYRARQVVAERTQKVALPAQVDAPELGPISSIMGEITFIALTADPEKLSLKQLRRIAETVVRRNLLAIPGISQVVPIGGEVREFQAELHIPTLVQQGMNIAEVADALEGATRNPAAGFHLDRGQEYLVRGLGRARGVEDLRAAVVRVTDGVPLTVGDVATVREGTEPQRGTASYNTKPAVILSVQKQPGANTLELMRKVDAALAELEETLPEGVVIEKENFRQSDFIQAAIRNISVAMRDGAVLVVLILIVFLGNMRTTLVSAVALPLSLIAGVLVVAAAGGTINTMTLGGLTIAIGALVDDAIIVVENVFRMLREEWQKSEAERRQTIQVVFSAASGVLNVIFFADLIIMLVFVPLFFLPGMEGRFLRPLGFAYIVALAASLFVSLTVTPVLCYGLLRYPRLLEKREPWLIRILKGRYRTDLDRALVRPLAIYAMMAVLFAGAAVILPFLGRSFLPPFNEGSLTVSVVSAPGITLEESDEIGRAVEEALLEFPETVSASRRTGRAEKDEHVQGVNASEMEVVLRPGRPKEELLAAMRRAVATIPGASVSFGQPISHRIDHMISGSKASLALKIFGSDLSVIRDLARQVESVVRDVPGIVDLSNQEQASIPQLLIDFDRTTMARHGLSAVQLAQVVEVAFQGTVVGEIFEDGISSRVVVRLPERLREHRDQLAELPVTTPDGRLLRMDNVATVRFDLGPSLIRRENVQRMGMLTANIAGADLAGTVEAARRAVEEAVELPTGYRIAYGGQFEEGARSARNLALLSVLILAAMYALLFIAFRRHRHALIVLVNLPLALIGGVIAVALGDGVLSIAVLVGFIALFGIATRNGVLLVARYQDLMAEGLPLADAVRRGSQERLTPVLMTGLAAGLALIPLVLAGHEPGNEIQSPMGQVILGGLLTSTLLNMLVVPVLFARWGGGGGSERD
jgi:CzcA family heavy metal efflux pump